MKQLLIDLLVILAFAGVLYLIFTFRHDFELHTEWPFVEKFFFTSVGSCASMFYLIARHG